MKFTSMDYKYQLEHDEVFQTSLRPRSDINTRFICLTTDGVLTIKAGYAWDGVSGPIRDTEHNHHAGLCHDALYQLMRMGMMSKSLWKEADNEFAKLCLLYGTHKVWVNIYIAGLKIANGKYANPKERKKIYVIKSIH